MFIVFTLYFNLKLNDCVKEIVGCLILLYFELNPAKRSY